MIDDDDCDDGQNPARAKFLFTQGPARTKLSKQNPAQMMADDDG